MSGAFNIDVEVGKADGKGNMVIYCQSLTAQWQIQRSRKEFKTFCLDLSKERTVREARILSSIKTKPNADDYPSCQVFISRLACRSIVLKLKLLQDFLDIPESVRKGLEFASEKKVSANMLREGYMQKHPRFIKHVSGKKYMRLAADAKGGSLMCYLDENADKEEYISSIKIGQQTEIQSLIDRGIKDALVIKCGKRQWVIQAASARDYNVWNIKLKQLLKGVMVKTMDSVDDLENDAAIVDEKEEKANGEENKKLDLQNDKLVQENSLLKERLDFFTQKVEDMSEELEMLRAKQSSEFGGTQAMQAKIQKEFAKEKQELTRDYNLQYENLTSQLADIRRAIDSKTAMDGDKSKLKIGFSFGDKGDDMKSEMDAEKAILDTFTEQERETIKFMHRHLHRHQSKHMHDHRHIHLHEDSKENVDGKTIVDFDCVDKHTISHTITFTNTQFKISGGFF